MKIRNMLMAVGAIVAFAAAPAMGQEIEAQKKYTCKSKYLAADWRVLVNDGGDNNTFCEMSFDKSGNITSSECFEKKTNKGVGSMSGKLKLNKSCALTGSLTYKPASGESVDLDAELYMDAAATSFAGILSDESGEFDVVQAIRMK